MPEGRLTRAEAEDFLYHEAELLDAWRLEEWAALFTEDATYRIPSPDHPAGGPEESLYLVADDRRRLAERVRQLLGTTAWAENPRSRTRHFITNVRVQPDEGGLVLVRSNFLVCRFRQGESHQYVGEYRHRLDPGGGSPRIVAKTVLLDLESLRDVGKVSILL